MLGPGLSTSFRSMTGRYAVLVTDVGAFTTDFGYVDIDCTLNDDDWNRPRIVQASVELGIRELDKAVLGVLHPAAQGYFESRPAEEWERRKRFLYLGEPQRVVAGQETITIGADLEGEAIQEEIRLFADRVCEAREQFCAFHKLNRVHEEAVTGGGSGVPALRASVLETIKSAHRRTHDLWDPKEPDEAIAAGAGRMTPAEKDRRREANRVLVRASSALGGASVLFG